MADKNKSTLSPAAWIFRWVLFIPHILPFTAILFWHPDYWKAILGLFLKNNGQTAWAFFEPFWIRIPGLGLGLMLVAWLLSAFLSALSTLLPSVIYLFLHGTVFLPSLFIPFFGIIITLIILAILLANGLWPFIKFDDLVKYFEVITKMQPVDMA